MIVDEIITASLDLARTFDYRGFGDYFGGRGGGSGQALPALRIPTKSLLRTEMISPGIPT